ncbi:UNVERIFIED_CONTAM: hypothetical protein Scaly_0080100 [Sesamum calycinum]|uniref:Ty3-gypsy retrotransposon protein n=1 Tax=Sesamum calycinum TaxID=2727403 RepID=A0AAW2SVC3_9LAMI
MDTQGKVVKSVNSNSPYQSFQAQEPRVSVLLRGAYRKSSKNLFKRLLSLSTSRITCAHLAMKAKEPSEARSREAQGHPLLTPRIDSLKKPMGYQPPKFQQFDSKGNPEQHAAHFVEMCNNLRTDDDHLVKQFVQSLKGNAFDWHTDLDADLIDGWE